MYLKLFSLSIHHNGWMSTLLFFRYCKYQSLHWPGYCYLDFSTRINNGISYCNELKIYSLEFQFCTLLYKAVEIGEGTIHFSTIIIFYFEREIMMSLVKAVTHKWSFKKVDHEKKKKTVSWTSALIL